MRTPYSRAIFATGPRRAPRWGGTVVRMMSMTPAFDVVVRIWDCSSATFIGHMNRSSKPLGRRHSLSHAPKIPRRVGALFIGSSAKTKPLDQFHSCCSPKRKHKMFRLRCLHPRTNTDAAPGGRVARFAGTVIVETESIERRTRSHALDYGRKTVDPQP